jgi:hypothetical protein
MPFLRTQQIIRDASGCLVLSCPSAVNPIIYYSGRKYATEPNIPSTQKRIQKTVRLASSDYVHSLVPQVVYNPPNVYGQIPWNNASDRAVAGVVRSIVPSHGDSTTRSLTRARPGACSASGKGVDIKHGSYARYLAKLKGRTVARTCEETPVPAPVRGNKTNYFSISHSNSCKPSTHL